MNWRLNLTTKFLRFATRAASLILAYDISSYSPHEACHAVVGDFRPFHITKGKKMELVNSDSDPLPE